MLKNLVLQKILMVQLLTSMNDGVVRYSVRKKIFKDRSLRLILW